MRLRPELRRDGQRARACATGRAGGGGVPATEVRRGSYLSRERPASSVPADAPGRFKNRGRDGCRCRVAPVRWGSGPRPGVDIALGPAGFSGPDRRKSAQVAGPSPRAHFRRIRGRSASIFSPATRATRRARTRTRDRPTDTAVRSGFWINAGGPDRDQPRARPLRPISPPAPPRRARARGRSPSRPWRSSARAVGPRPPRGRGPRSRCGAGPPSRRRPPKRPPSRG